MLETKAKTPNGFREIAEEGVARTKVNFDKAKAATEEATDLLKNGFTTAAKAARDYNLKIFEIAHVNINTAFDYAHEILRVNSISEFVDLSTAHARKQFETMTEQTKELTNLARKAATDVTEPLKMGMKQGASVAPD